MPMAPRPAPATDGSATGASTGAASGVRRHPRRRHRLRHRWAARTPAATAATVRAAVPNRQRNAAGSRPAISRGPARRVRGHPAGSDIAVLRRVSTLFRAASGRPDRSSADFRGLPARGRIAGPRSAMPASRDRGSAASRSPRRPADPDCIAAASPIASPRAGRSPRGGPPRLSLTNRTGAACRLTTS